MYGFQKSESHLQARVSIRKTGKHIYITHPGKLYAIKPILPDD